MLVEPCFERQTHADDLERICDKNGGNSRQRTAEQAPQWSFMSGAWYQRGAELLIGKEFDGGVREYAEERGRVTAEEPAHARLGIDVAHGGHDAKPRARVFGKLRIGGLEEDFHPVERADDSLSLEDLLEIFDKLVGLGYERQWESSARVESGEVENILHIQRFLLPTRSGGYNLGSASWAFVGSQPSLVSSCCSC